MSVLQFKSVPMVRFFYILILLGFGFSVFAQNSYDHSVLETKNIKKSELIIATIATGMVGGHRLLLKKKASTVIIYCVTLGGGLGFLPVVDLFTILFTKKENLDKLHHQNFFLFNTEQ